ncbi:unnamed protein product [Phaeothamnion confervicola]
MGKLRCYGGPSTTATRAALTSFSFGGAEGNAEILQVALDHGCPGRDGVCWLTAHDKKLNCCSGHRPTAFLEPSRHATGLNALEIWLLCYCRVDPCERMSL